LKDRLERIFYYFVEQCGDTVLQKVFEDFDKAGEWHRVDTQTNKPLSQDEVKLARKACTNI
jgi:hypothetical protein